MPGERGNGDSEHGALLGFPLRGIMRVLSIAHVRLIPLTAETSGDSLILTAVRTCGGGRVIISKKVKFGSFSH